MSPAIEETKTSSVGIGLNAQKVASKRYSLKDPQGNPIEDWPAIVRRVVTHVSAAEIDSTSREESNGKCRQPHSAREVKVVDKKN